MEETKECKNCYYYSQHYTMQSTRFRSIHCGHCLHAEVKRYKKQPHENCDFWQSIEIKKEERKNSIQETLEHMQNHLREISLILKSDS